MNFKQTKLMATVAVAALTGAVFAPTSSQAAVVTPNVNVSLITNSAITVADGVDMAFGTWFLIFRNADAFELRITPAGVTSIQNIGGGTADSQAVNTIAAPVAGTVTVSLPAGINGIVVNMQRTLETDFTDAGLTLTRITYSTVTEPGPTVMTAATNYPVTVVTGGVAETVSFGADIQVTATPADATHTATFQVSFAY